MAVGGPWLKLYRQYRQNGKSKAEARRLTEEALGPMPPGTILKAVDATDEDDNFSMEVRVCKVVSKLGLVLGYGMVSKVNGDDYYDLQGHHIPEDVLFEAAADFMLHSREAAAMHKGANLQGDHTVRGTVVFAFPMTTEVAKAFDVQVPVHGLMIAMRPDTDMLAKFESGEYTGFSIGGAGILEEVA